MTNVSTLFTLRNLVSYLPDGVGQLVEALSRALPPEVQIADDLQLYVADAVHTIVAITTTVGATPYLVVAKSNGTACTVKVYGKDDATVGTDDALVSVGVSGTSGQITGALVLGAGMKTLADAASGLGIAAPATDIGTGAVANDPTVYVVYRPA